MQAVNSLCAGLGHVQEGDSARFHQVSEICFQRYATFPTGADLLSL